MVRFCARNTTNEINNNDWNYNTRFNDLFPKDQWANVFGVHNVVDIMVMTFTGSFYSISPKAVAEKVPFEGEVEDMYVPPNRGGNKGNGKEDDHNSIIGGRSEKGRELVGHINGGEWAAWNGDKENNKYRPYLKDIGNDFRQEPNIQSAWYEEIHAQWKYEGAGGKGRYPFTWENMNDSWWRYNQMCQLINFITAFDQAISRGYKFFNPNLQARVNYIKGKFNVENHMLIMYLDAPTAALSWGCFNPRKDDAIDKNFLYTFFQSDPQLSDRNYMLRMGGERCGSATPRYSYLTVGNYGMGIDFYSPNTMFRAVLQADGNLVVYNIDKNHPIFEKDAIWSSGTSLARYPVQYWDRTYNVGLTKPTLSVQSDGNVVIYSRTGRAIWSTGSRGQNIKLALDNDGVLFVFDNDNTNAVMWSNNNNQHKNGNWNSLQAALLSKSCKPGDPRHSLSGYDISKIRLGICKTGDEILKNKDLCNYLTITELGNDMDNGSRDIKNDIDRYMKDVYCTPARVAKGGDDIKKFCACYVPYDDTAKTLIANGLTIKCTQQCIENGYHSSEQPKSCDSKICIMDQAVRNLMDSKFISQTCNIGNSGPVAPAPTTTTVDTTATTNTNATTTTTKDTSSDKITTTATKDTSEDKGKITTKPVESSTTTSSSNNNQTITIIIYVVIVVILGLLLKSALVKPISNPFPMNNFFNRRYYQPIQNPQMIPANQAITMNAQPIQDPQMFQQPTQNQDMIQAPQMM